MLIKSRLIPAPSPNGNAAPTAARPAPVALRSGADRPKDLAFRSIVRTVGLIERVMQPYFARFGITGSQWGVLRALHRAEAEGLPGLRLTDLSENLVIRPPSVTGVVDRLERLLLVTRTGVPGDLRVKQVALTPKARQLLNRVLSEHAGQIDAVLDGLTGGDQEELHRLLQKLNSHLEKMSLAVQSAVAQESEEPERDGHGRKGSRPGRSVPGKGR